MTTDVVSANIAKVTLAVSSGATIAAPQFGSDMEEVILYVFGIVVSIIALSYNECHVSKSDSIWKLITKASRYVVVGMFAYPSAYAYAGTVVWNYSAFKGLAGVIVTLSIVMLMDAWIQGKSDKLKGGK